MNVVSNRLSKALGLNDEAVAAYYQPIIALDSREIMGYEVLGRAVKGDSVRSLGPFFNNESICIEDHIEVDRFLREQAISKLEKMYNPPMLFLNLKPNWIYRNGQLGELYTLTLLDKYKVDPGLIVIEITEESFNGPMEGLRAIVDRYRKRGCLIAIDDVGSGFSNTDRIAQIQPNLLKIDMHMIKRSATHKGYFNVLRSFSDLAEQIGASLLFEGVENREDLSRAIESGARYVQGFMFARAEPDFSDPKCFASIVEHELECHLRRLVTAERYWQSQAELLGELLSSIIDSTDGELEQDQWLKQLISKVGENCIRLYMCNEDGMQLSANYCRNGDDSWRCEESFRGANWSWRPYFVPNLVQLNESKGAIVSRAYTDLDSHALIRTISVRVAPGLILFADSKVQRLNNEKD